MMRLAIASLTILAVACGDGSGTPDALGGAGDATVVDAPPVTDAPPLSDAESCEPPDMLLVLDRTMSMHRRPDGSVPPDTAAGHMQSKWYIAITAIEQLTADLEGTIRFGLELFPRDPGQDLCVTLSQRINDVTAMNVQCEAGEVLVSPDTGTVPAIAAALDPETTRLCRSTPIGAGLETARSELESLTDPVRDQFAILITDGQGTCNMDALALSEAQALAAAGIKLYVIGFDGSGGSGVDNAHLNDLACAGQTAPLFPTPCTDDGAGNYTATSPGGAPLYFLADDAAALGQALAEVAGEVCCNCVD
jgi:hypothetical protein